MLSLLRYAPLSICLALLPACFVSDQPLIGEGIRIHDGPIALCLEPDDPCSPAQWVGDQYLVDDSDGSLPIRFVHLTEAGGLPVWLGEAELSDEEDEERAWAYVVARAEGMTPDGTLNVRIVMPDCNIASEDARARYGIEQVDRYACMAADLEQLSAYLVERHAGDFADTGWWLDPYQE